MAAIETINVHVLQYTDCLWLILYFINVLATDRKIGFLNRVNIFLSTYDERWRKFYDVTEGAIYLRVVYLAKYALFC